MVHEEITVLPLSEIVARAELRPLLDQHSL